MCHCILPDVASCTALFAAQPPHACWFGFAQVLPERLCGVHTETVAEALMQNAEQSLAERKKAAAAGSEAAQQPAFRIYENADIRAMRVAKL